MAATQTFAPGGKQPRVATDAALLLVNILKTNMFFVNVPLKLLSPEAFYGQKCTKFRLAAGLCPDPLGELTALPKPLAGFKEPTSKRRGGEER